MMIINIVNNNVKALIEIIFNVLILIFSINWMKMNLCAMFV